MSFQGAAVVHAADQMIEAQLSVSHTEQSVIRPKGTVLPFRRSAGSHKIKIKALGREIGKDHQS